MLVNSTCHKLPCAVPISLPPWKKKEQAFSSCTLGTFRSLQDINNQQQVSKLRNSAPISVGTENTEGEIPAPFGLPPKGTNSTLHNCSQPNHSLETALETLISTDQFYYFKAATGQFHSVLYYLY